VIPLADRDFDPAQVAIVWRALRDRGIEVRFATTTGFEAVPDQIMLTGEGLDVWGLVPGLRRFKVLGLLMRADGRARSAYQRMWADPWFQSPETYASLTVDEFDGLILPGGHRARGMCPFLENSKLQNFVGLFFASGKPVAAIGQGVLLAARSRSPITGRSVLFGRKTTALPWSLERKAARLSALLGRFWDADYFRTYPESGKTKKGALSIERQVTSALEKPSDFLDAPRSVSSLFWKRTGLFRDKPSSERAAHVVIDDAYISARWAGDAHTLAQKFIAMLSAHHEAGRFAATSRHFVEDEVHRNERSRAWT
jgi:putative intracellular protease/amidase